MKLVFQHLRETRNIGDRWCSPFDYFNWPGAEARDLRKAGAAYDIGIYGGGKIFGSLSKEAGVIRGQTTRHIAWGVSTVQTFPISFRYSASRRLCELIGSRDFGDKRYDFAPCVSCMSPLFDIVKPPEHDVVFYYHAGKTAGQGINIPSWMPSLSNNCSSLEEALAFIASGRTVVSNSYHGVYWSLLMGRRVICIPFSGKFSSYRYPPFYSSAKRWADDLRKGLAQPQMLQVCREATLRFKYRVDAVIDEVNAAHSRL
ncbi:polysaccharide pyruvyl transferase family protein [Xinfangfangia sp. CPCC 101601]|uniref:Polysaccharide pyruvyl transferase family protein n=1 Tax=Pseudogemmobacter lacusdianii TaxID=3069608 RepID=A0ABU0VVL3_9RHOB|nr:polysaccharide pyruvyl transferase family protein [Xinfangfangia sp. CPCC 101601]MDQ2065781.1 polysaccharide pyruvyl transferase family protein [Xinfangfangia sp. CPCC 101601]